MDVVRKQTSSNKYLKYIWFFGIFSLAIVLLIYFMKAHFAVYRIDTNQVDIAQVKSGLFKVDLRCNGKLIPEHTYWLSSEIEARVEHVFVKAGSKVKIGDRILQLKNPLLKQQALELAWELDALSAEHHALSAKWQSQISEQEGLVKLSLLNFKQQQQIEAVSQEGANELDSQRSETLWQIEKKRLSNLKQDFKAQLAASAARLNKVKNAYKLAQAQQTSLDVKATKAGVLLAIPVKEGDKIIAGSNLAKIAKLQQFYAELSVSENQSRHVNIGDKVLFNTNNRSVSGEVGRIDPLVKGGDVTIDVVFNDVNFEGVRPYLSSESKIEARRINNAVFVERPLSAKENSMAYVYKLSADGKSANKVEVEYGLASSHKIQIITGLAEGDRIILSNDAAYQHLDKIYLN